MRNLILLLMGMVLAGGAKAADDPPIQYKLHGSYKSIFSNEELHQTGIFEQNDIPLTEQRLRMEGNLSRSWLSVDIADEMSYTNQRPVQSTVPVPSFDPLSAWQATSTLINTDSQLLTNRIDRAYVQLSAGEVEMRVGKQVIDEGVGHIFNAISQVPRYAFTYIDQEYPKTEDAVSVLWKGSLTLEARYLPKVPGQTQDNFHLRAKGDKAGYDVALTAGRSDDKMYVGLEAAGNLGDSLLRMEAVGYQWQSNSAAQALIGWDDVLSSKISTTVEVFYNGFGELSDYTLTPLIHRSTPYRGKYYAGAVVTWTISPRWKSVFNAIVNVWDPSALFQVFVDYSITDNLDVVLGRYQGLKGRADAEFGGTIPLPAPYAPGMSIGLPDITYLEGRYYF